MMWGGVEVDDFGVVIVYYICKVYQGDWFSGGWQVIWEWIFVEIDWGCLIVVYDYDFDWVSQY